MKLKITKKLFFLIFLFGLSVNSFAKQSDATAIALYLQPKPHVEVQHYVENNILRLKSEVQMQSLSIFNVLGQQIGTYQVNKKNYDLALYNYKKGTYIARVIYDNKSHSFKFIVR